MTSSHRERGTLPASILLGLQGLYYFITGIWPLVSIDTFQMVTGPKLDLWLVQTVGVLIAVIAVVLLVAAVRQQISAEVVLLAVGSAAALAGVDVVFVSQDQIPPIYLLDAAAEGVLLVAWTACLAWRAWADRPVMARVGTS